MSREDDRAMLLRRVRLALPLFALVLGLLAPIAVLTAGPASAAVTLTVNNTGDSVPIQPGILTLRKALNRAAGDGQDTVIQLQAGATYVLTRCNALSENANATGDLDYGDRPGTLTIDGNGATIHQTCAGERVLDVADPAVVLRELTITGGNVTTDAGDTTAGGGGIRSTGGVFGDPGPPPGTELTLVDVAVQGNTAAGGGGGISAFEPDPGLAGLRVVLTRTEISGNATDGFGGGVAGLGPVSLVDSSVVGNTADEVGGVLGAIGITLRDSTVAENNEPAPGAEAADGVELDSTLGSIVMTHSTVRAGEGDGPAVVATDLTSRASVIDAGLADAACAIDDPIVTQGANADDDGTCGFVGITDQSGVADLGLGVLGAFGGSTPTIRPASDSPLVDAEAVGACLLPDNDQRGIARAFGAGCDTGSVELRARPDAMLRQGGGLFLGDNRIGFNGQGQTLAVSIPRVGGVGVTLRFQNDGERQDRLRVLGPATDGRFTVRYTRGSVNVTNQVVAGSYLTPALAVGGTDLLVMTLTPVRGAATGASRVLLVTATSQTSASAKDVVGVNATVA